MEYLAEKHIIPNIPMPRLMSDSLPLAQSAINLLAKADSFFISTLDHKLDIETSHRSGPPGFVRLDANNEGSCILVYPGYTGVHLYQTLGDLSTSPQAGLVFPDFETGNVLYLNGTQEILVREDAIRVLPRSNIAFKINVKAARFVENGLSFRSSRKGFSPYEPHVPFFVKKQTHNIPSTDKQKYVTLVDKQLLSPTVARFRFRITDPEKKSRWKPGQYVILSFRKSFDIACTNMRNDDSRSLNDDYIRKFTISSGPGSLLDYEQFEITIRVVGIVTKYLFLHDSKTQLEIPLKGFSGEFFFHQNETERIYFVAGGIGITPLLAQTSCLDLKRIQAYWAVRADDLGLVLDSFGRAPGLSRSTKLFVTGKVHAQAEENLIKLETIKASVERRRMDAKDLQLGSDSSLSVGKWYVCTGAGLRKTVLEWLKGRNVVFETFNY